MDCFLCDLASLRFPQKENARTQRRDAFVARLPEEMRGYLPFLAGVFCDSAHRAEVAEFFRTRAQKMTGAPRALAQVLERIDVCTESKAVLGPRLAAFLKKY